MPAGGAVSRVHFLLGDFFRLTPAALPRGAAADMVWDRASLVALRPEDREGYVAALHRSVAPGGTILLSTFEYDQERANGPPFAVPEREVRRLFPGPDWSVRVVERKPYDMSGNSKFAGLEFVELVTIVTRA